jgi:hypothetical protein
MAASLPAACADDGDALALDDLRNAGTTCPLDLDTALADAGLEGGDIDVTVNVGSGVGNVTSDEWSGDVADLADYPSPLDQLGGVWARCSLSAGGDEPLAAEIIASPEPGGARLYTSALVDALGIDELDLRSEEVDVMASIHAADRGVLGDLAGLGSDAPVAFAHLTVEDADGAALVVRGGLMPPWTRTPHRRPGRRWGRGGRRGGLRRSGQK